MEYFNLPSRILFYISFSFHKQLQYFSFVIHGIHSISPRVIIYKKHKVVVTSNRCRLSRSTKIYVNIVQNHLSAMSRSAESYIGLLSDDAMLTKFQFAGLDTVWWRKCSRTEEECSL